MKSEKYDELYNFISNEINVINPCNIRKNSNNQLTCEGIRRKEYNNREKLCCIKIDGNTCHDIFKKDCIHLEEFGCSTNSLSCKLWFCDSAWRNVVENNDSKTVKNFILNIQYVNQSIRLYQIPAMSRLSKKENFNYKYK